jgi:mannose-1-phosphate guanylyltransferase
MDRISNHHYFLILCGGTGPHLWPLSRADNPKQFLKILSESSLLQQTISRAKYCLPVNHIFLISNQNYLTKIQQHTSHLIPPKQIISEPEKKNTTMAIIYGLSVINQIDPNAIVTALPSDQYISPLYLFRRQINQAAKFASISQAIVAFGIKPEYPNTSYGYITPESTKQKYFKVKQFIEKPDAKTAKFLIDQKSYWNSGIYTFTVKTLVNELYQNCPDYAKLYQKLLSDGKKNSVVQKIYQISPNLPIDISISQRSTNLIMIPAKFNWNDLGEWKTIYRQTKKNIATLDSDTKFLEVNSQKCLLHTTPGKLIGLVGVNNLAIIDSPNALLVCNIVENDSFLVRDLVGKIVKNKSTSHFFLKSDE